MSARRASGERDLTPRRASGERDVSPVTAERLSAQLLAGPPARDPTAVARRLLAIQGQDLRGARLAIRARTEGLTVADVDRALTDERSLLITWLNRGTLHLVASEDYHWLHALTTPQLHTANARRLAQEGVTPAEADRGVSVIERALGDAGPLTRAQLRERLAQAGVRTEGQALVHVLFAASLRGIAVRGPMIGAHHAYALVKDWIAPTRPIPRERALARLARRYLAGHGPAGDRDLAKWAGLPLRDARAGLAAIASELSPPRPGGLVALAGPAGAAEPGGRPSAGKPSGVPAVGALPPPRLLGAFEPVLMGWRSREPILGPDPAGIVAGGRFAPFALVNGRAAAVWKQVGGQVSIEPFADLPASALDALRKDALDVARFLGDSGAVPDEGGHRLRRKPVAE